MIETFDSPVYRLNLDNLSQGNLNLTQVEAEQRLPPALAKTTDRLAQLIEQRGTLVDDASLAAAVPSGQLLLEVHRNQSRVTGVTVVETLPVRQDVLAVRSTEGKIKAGDEYQITSSVSVATSLDLQNARTDYPAWAIVKYTQLPEGLPQRVKDLAAQLTAGAETPYGKAKAIEVYLSQFPYTLQVTPPPFDADGVDHFLFTLRKGYSEYFASSMAVLLRSVDVPTRLATGYTQGDKLPDQNVYLVTDSHSHAWVEVYFPDYGWVSFEPTPGGNLPDASLAARESEPEPLAISDEQEPAGLECFEETFECDETETSALEGELRGAPGGFSGRIVAALPWVLAVLGGAAILGGTGAILWRRHMSSTDDPRTAYHRMAFPGKFSSLAPLTHQTPYQYRERLRNALPNYGAEVSTLVDSYVRNQYGAKRLTVEDRNQVVSAWMRIRMPMLRRIFASKRR